jgi:hypothetical protein
MPRTLTSREAGAVRAWLSSPTGSGELSAWTRSLLAAIREGLCFPPAIRHPLGFTCIQLYRNTTWGLCMHVWDGARRSQAAGPIHSHSWELSSQVVCGRLENIKVGVSDGCPFPTHRVLEITSTHRTDLVHATRRLVTRTESESVHIRAGENYQLPADTFHVSRPTGVGLTATVLLAKYRRGNPELALGRLDSEDQIVTRQACRAADVKLLAEVMLNELTGNSGDRAEIVE